jgi:nucleosome assembly protein 1-like 1
LTKEFDLDGEVIKKSFGDQIAWKEGKNITIKIVKKKNKKKGGEKKTKEVKEKSFFNFFLDVEIDSEEEENEADEDNNEDVEALESQYEIAQALYEEVVPKSLEYYLGLIETLDDYGEFDGEDDDEEEEEEPKPKKNKGK